MHIVNDLNKVGGWCDFVFGAWGWEPLVGGGSRGREPVWNEKDSLAGDRCGCPNPLSLGWSGTEEIIGLDTNIEARDLCDWPNKSLVL